MEHTITARNGVAGGRLSRSRERPIGGKKGYIPTKTKSFINWLHHFSVRPTCSLTISFHIVEEDGNYAKEADY